MKEKYDLDVILRSLHYYAKNHPNFRGRVKKELENWKEVERILGENQL